MKKTAFVYQWENNENDMKYIGSHYGFLDDGYVSSSKYFNEIYNKNPSQFTRTILSFYKTRLESLKSEEQLLSSVNASKNKNYYNLINHPGKGWSHHDDPTLARIYYKRISNAKKGKPSKNKDKKMNTFQKQKLSDFWEVKNIITNETIIVQNMREFCEKNSLNPSAMSSVARGNRRHHKNYWCKKITNRKNVTYCPKKWESKGKTGGFKSFGAKNGFSKKVFLDGVLYDCIKDASKETGLSYYLIKKYGDFNV